MIHACLIITSKTLPVEDGWISWYRYGILTSFAIRELQQIIGADQFGSNFVHSATKALLSLGGLPWWKKDHEFTSSIDEEKCNKDYIDIKHRHLCSLTMWQISNQNRKPCQSWNCVLVLNLHIMLNTIWKRRWMNLLFLHPCNKSSYG